MAHPVPIKGFVQVATPISSHYLGPVLNPPTSHYPALSIGTEPKSQGHCQRWHHKLKVG